MSKQFAVLGSPIRHSRSPQLHRAGFDAMGFDAEYSRVELSQDIEKFIADSNQLWDGFSVTMPLKVEAAGFAQTTDEWVARTGSCNTLVFREGVWHGHNTDAYGLQRALQGLDMGRVLILGSGATARTSYEALREKDRFIRLWARSPEKLSWLDADADADECIAESPVLADYDLVISTIPATAVDEIFYAQPIGPKSFFSAAYSQSPEVLLTWKAHCRVVSGLEMLYWQAVAQQSLFMGVELEKLEANARFTGAMREALIAVKE